MLELDIKSSVTFYDRTEIKHFLRNQIQWYDNDLQDYPINNILNNSPVINTLYSLTRHVMFQLVKITDLAFLTVQKKFPTI